MLTETRLTPEMWEAMWNPTRPTAGDDKGASYRTDRLTALTKKFIQTHPAKARKMLVLDFDGDNCDEIMWLIRELVYDLGILPEPNWITLTPSGGAHAGFFIESSVGTEKGIAYFMSVFNDLKDISGSDLNYTGMKTRNPLLHQTEWLRAEPYTLRELASFTKKKPANWYKPKNKIETHGSRHLELFEQLRAWSYIEWRKPMFETRILVEAQRINMEFSEELPLSHIVSIANSIERFISKHFTEEKYREIKSQKGKKSGAVRAAKAVPKNKMLLDMDAAGLSVAEIAEQVGKSYEATAKAIQRAKKKAEVTN
jgi:hypothetical protein